MKFDFNQIKNIAKDVSKEVINVVGDKYLEIKANTNFDEEKYDEVIKTANEILKLDKFNYGIILLKAKALMKENKYDEAIDTFNEALKIDKTKTEPLIHIATIKELQGNIDEAIDIYNSILEKEEDNISASLDLARNYFIKREYENVHVNFLKVETENEKLLNSEDYYKWGISLKEMKKTKQAKIKFEKANSLHPSDKYIQAITDIKNEELQPLKDKAYHFYNNNEFNKTIHMFTRINYASTSILTHEDFYTWGLCLEEEGRDKDAIDIFKKAYDKKQCKEYLDKINSIETKHKNEFNNFIKKAILSYDNKHYLEAEKYFSKASEGWHSLTHEQYFIWGICLMNIGAENQAKNKFKKANSLNPCSKYSNAYKNELLNMKNTSLLLKEAKKYYNDNNSETLKYINKILELDSKNIDALLMKGNILLRKNNQFTWSYYEKVLELDPSNKTANELVNFKKENGINAIDRYWFETGIKEINCKNYTKAVEALNTSLNINPKNASTWLHKGDALFWKGDFRESIKCFDKAIELDPDECDDALAIKGMALIRLNKNNEGQASLRESLEHNPKNAFALAAIKNIPNFIDVPISDMYVREARKINVNPILFSKIAYIKTISSISKKYGESVDFQHDFYRGCILTHSGNKYFFNLDELDGAVVYAQKLWRESMWGNMSDEEKDKINKSIEEVMKNQKIN